MTVMRSMIAMVMALFAVVPATLTAAPTPPTRTPTGSGMTDAATSDGDERRIRLISFNIRYDTPSDGEHRWKLRGPRVVEYLTASKADFIGIQEALPSQRADLEESLTDYGSIGRSRETSPAEGEATPILYDRTRWVPVASRNGTFWLSESPSTPGSKSWKSSVPRIATWGIFRERNGDRRVMVLNTHLDHQSQEAREGAVREIARFLQGEATGIPVIVMGDFNAAPNNPAVRTLCEGWDGSPPLVDTYSVLHPGPERGTGTSHGFRRTTAGPRIDAILISDGLRAVAAGIDRSGTIEAPLSDHFAVTAEVRFAPAAAAPVTPAPATDSARPDAPSAPVTDPTAAPPPRSPDAAPPPRPSPGSAPPAPEKPGHSEPGSR